MSKKYKTGTWIFDPKTERVGVVTNIHNPSNPGHQLVGSGQVRIMFFQDDGPMWEDVENQNPEPVFEIITLEGRLILKIDLFSLGGWFMSIFSKKVRLQRRAVRNAFQHSGNFVATAHEAFRISNLKLNALKGAIDNR